MSRRPPGRLRIIGGEWRSRLIDFEAGDDEVRPTPDRVRQTVFDWLAPMIEGAACVDCFAGSGALGLEALSRGAAWISFVETGRATAAAIRAAAVRLGAGSRAEVIETDALAWLRGTVRRFDIAFVDPPYATGLLLPALHALAPRLAPHNRVYIEWPQAAPPVWPAGWQVLREKSAGQVSFALATYGAPGESP